MGGRLLAKAMMTAACICSVGSIGLFVAKPLGAFLHFGWPLESALIWDAGLSLFFFAQHSIMVRRFFRRLLRIPEHYWGVIYATASGVALALVVVLWQSSGDALLVITEPLRLVAKAGSVLGLAIFVWGFAALHGSDMIGVGALRAHLRGVKPKVSPFVVRGPYRWVRHPLYFAVLVLIWCEPQLTADRLLFNLLWTVWIVVATRFEEADLVQDFGDTYRRYQQRVPMLIPWRGPAIRAGEI